MRKRVSLSELSPLINEALKNGDEVVFTITGNSMAPLLRHRRDKVRLVGAGIKPLGKHDIPLYLRRDGKYILHRIIAVKKDGYVTAGDNQVNKEYPVYPSQVIGVVNGIWRDGAYISGDDFRYRIYCWLWSFLYPIRRYCSRLKRL